MRKNREYRRDLSDYDIELLRKLYENHLNSAKYALTKEQRKRLLGLAKKEKYTEESDFWYHLKHQARKSLLDLELFVSVANDDMVKEVFEPYKQEDFLSADLIGGATTLEAARKILPDVKAEYLHTDLKRILTRILVSNEKDTAEKEHWKYRLAVDMVSVGLAYLGRRPEFRKELHRRLFQDTLDSIGTDYYRY